MYSTFRKQNIEILEKKRCFSSKLSLKKKKKSDNITFFPFLILFHVPIYRLPNVQWKKIGSLLHTSVFFRLPFSFYKKANWSETRSLFWESLNRQNFIFSTDSFACEFHSTSKISLHPTEISRKYSFLLLREKICILR